MTITRRGVIQILATAAGIAVLEPQRVVIPSPDEPPIEAADSSCTPRSTPLDRYLRSHGIKPSVLARESGYSRQHLSRLRMGRMLPTKRCALHLTAACRRLSGERVRPRDLFDAWLANPEGEA